MTGRGPEPAPDGEPASSMRFEVLSSGGASSGAEERSAWRWWRRQSTPRRAALVCASTVVLGIALLATCLTANPQAPPPVPTAWPAEHAFVSYEGTVPFADPRDRSADFLIAVRNQDRSSMTVTQISFAYRGLTLRTNPRLPLAVPPGQTVHIHLVTTVTDCSGIPVDDELPFIDVTFRNIRSIGQESEILGDRYTSDLHRAMTAACRRG